MKLYIPTNGERLRLTADWTFTLYSENYGNRNKTLFERLQVEKIRRPDQWRGDILRYPVSQEVTLPTETVLQVDRIYIRKGAEEYDSITFYILKHPVWSDPKRKTLARFWAKLPEVNTIEFEPVK